MPLEIVGLGQNQVTFVWNDDEKDVWDARDLRLRCTCALCKSEITGERVLDESSVPPVISVTNMSLVGNYGVSVHFSDGHNTGIYRFADLYESRRKG
jgi:DUF971 family protein